MPDFEVVLRLADGSGRETRFAFALEPGQQVLFGRSPDADIVIPDHNRKVSSRHGRIVCQPDGSLRGYDLASLNGTYLHGSALDTEIGGELTNGDELRVGDFQLLLAMAPTAAPCAAGAEAGLAQTAAPPGPEPARDADAARSEGVGARRVQRVARSSSVVAAGPLREAVERAYADSLQQDASSRGERIAAALATGLATVPAEGRELATAALLDQFLTTTGAAGGADTDDSHTDDSHADDGRADDGPAANTAAAHGESAGAAAAAAIPATIDATPSAPDGSSALDSRVAPGSVDHLQLLALRLVPGMKLLDGEQRARFMTLLAQVVEATLDWLARGLEGRAVFGQEFGAEVTLVFQRSTNPLKGMSRDELKRYLLDCTEASPPDTRRQYLDGVLEDLHDHQVGVLAGVEEAIVGVLTRLSPERVEGLASQQKVKGWTAAARSWQTYCQLHQELAEERTKLFHELISPAIQKGYLHRHGDRNGDAETP
ncbi:MAG: type VI secretion system-associated FHA domain protein [Planctomycetota bacterium]